MNSDPKEKIRDSILLHLQTWQHAGVSDVWRGLSHTNAQTVARDATANCAASQIVSTKDASLCLTLSDIQNELGNCTRCKLNTTRKNIVFGVGNPHAEVMFIGEGPGADEDQQGMPFVGRAGQLLTKMIEAMGLKREDVYIANIVKCRPPQNRNPEPDEITTCLPFLQKQIAAIKPKIIVALGKFAAQTICDTQIPITKLRGTFRHVNGTAVMPTFHPSFLLRSPEMKRPAWEDLKKVMTLLRESKGSGSV